MELLDNGSAQPLDRLPDDSPDEVVWLEDATLPAPGTRAPRRRLRLSSAPDPRALARSGQLRTPMIAALAALLGVVAGGWATASQGERDQRAAALGLADLSVVSVEAQSSVVAETGLPGDTSLVFRVRNRGEHPLTITGASFGPQPADGLPMDVEAGDRPVRLTVPLEQECDTPPSTRGDLVLDVRTADGAEQTVTLDQGSEFVVPPVDGYFVPSCGVTAVPEVYLNLEVQETRGVGPRISELDVMLMASTGTGRPAEGHVMGLEIAMPGVAVAPLRRPVPFSELDETVTFRVEVESCDQLQLPDDVGMAIARVRLDASGAAHSGDLITGRAPGEQEVYSGTLTMALVRLAGRACPEVLAD